MNGPVLHAWVTQRLEEGWSAQELIETMGERRIEAAREIVEACATTVLLNRASQLREGTFIQTSDRRVRVAARVEQPITLAVLNDVLSPEECTALIEMARPRLKPSTLVDPMSGQDVVSDKRSSWGMFFRPLENDLIAQIDRRLAGLSHLPMKHGEGLQILHYPCGAGSAPHFDYLQPGNEANRASIARSGQRISTIVTYLNDVPAGGQTIFPELGWAVSPQRGHAVYFESCDAEGLLKQASVHASKAVTEGEKWVATKWTRTQPFVSA